MKINNIKLLQSRVSNNKNCPDCKQEHNNKFDTLLNTEINKNQGFKISKHACDRMYLRNINFSSKQMNRINSAINKAKEKGIKESLIVIEDTSLVVNINKRIIVTAMNNKDAKEKVFTNIDGAIFI